MAEVRRWLVVDPQPKWIVGGPYKWDGETPWTPYEIEVNPNAGYVTMLEADALAEGYVRP